MSTVGRARGRPVDRDVERLAERRELVGGRGSVGVRRDEERAAAELDDVSPELRGRSRLTRALQADQRDDGGVALEAERPIARREELDELVVDDLDDLLTGGEAGQDLRTDGALPDPAHDVLDDLEVDVRLEQGQPDLARGGIDVRLADPAAAGERGKRLAQPIAEVVEHGRVRLR